MTNGPSPLDPVLQSLAQGVEGDWLKAVFSHPEKGTEWRKLTAEPVALTSGPAMKVTVHQEKGEYTSTVPAGQWASYLARVLNVHPSHVNIVGRTHDWHARFAKSGRWLVSKGKPSVGGAPAAPGAGLPPHDKPSHHPLPGDDPAARQLFIETGLFSLNGTLRGEAADKFRQVQHYIELLRPLGVLEPASEGEPHKLSIVDAGCGKAYLSLALFLYARRIGLDPELVGVDRDPAVIATVSGIASKLEITGARFEARSIGDFAHDALGADLLVSLHACDTATDEALAAGIRLGAEAIVLVPCCHHELVAQIDERMKAGDHPGGGDWAAVTGSGLLRHRLADILTDALRAAALEAHGYKADVLEFVSPEATARNLMIRAEKRPEGSGLESAKARGLAEYRQLRDAWGVSPALEKLLGGWPG